MAFAAVAAGNIKSLKIESPTGQVVILLKKMRAYTITHNHTRNTYPFLKQCHKLQEQDTQGQHPLLSRLTFWYSRHSQDNLQQSAQLSENIFQMAWAFGAGDGKAQQGNDQESRGKKGKQGTGSPIGSIWPKSSQVYQLCYEHQTWARGGATPAKQEGKGPGCAVEINYVERCWKIMKDRCSFTSPTLSLSTEGQWQLGSVCVLVSTGGHISGKGGVVFDEACSVAGFFRKSAGSMFSLCPRVNGAKLESFRINPFCTSMMTIVLIGRLIIIFFFIFIIFIAFLFLFLVIIIIVIVVIVISVTVDADRW